MQAIDAIVNSAAKTRYMSGGQITLLRGVPRAQRRGGPGGGPAQPGLLRLVRLGARAEGGRALRRCRRQGPAQGGDPRPQPGGLPRKRDALRPRVRRAGDGRLGCPSARPRCGAKAPARHHHRHSRMVGFALGGRREAGRRGHRGGGGRPALASPVGPRDGGREREEDQPPGRVEEGWAAYRRRPPKCASGWWSTPSTTSTPRRRACSGEDVPMPYAANLEALCLPSVDKIVQAVKGVVNR